MELYSRLALGDDEKTALFVYFTKNLAQKAEAAAVLPVCKDDTARVSFLKGSWSQQ